MNDRKIIFKNVSKTIDDQTILKDINLEIPEQGIYGIVGRNGSGKTVLIKCLCGFMPVTEGEIWVGEKQIGRDVEFIEDTGFIIETPGFLPRESGFRNLRYLASIRNVVGKERIRECITMVGLNPDDKKWAGKYSLGMRQRLGIAQAIMENPSLIILDEPMNGLDNHGVEEIRKLLLGLKEEGKLILIISHNREDINLLCDRVYEMDRGVLTQVMIPHIQDNEMVELAEQVSGKLTREDYPGLAVPVPFQAALCDLNTGSGSPVSSSAISLPFRCFCRRQSVLFSVRSAPDIQVCAVNPFHSLVSCLTARCSERGRLSRCAGVHGNLPQGGGCCGAVQS